MTPTLQLGEMKYLKSYGVLKDEMLRDRLVVGIRDLSLSGKLQLILCLPWKKPKH